MSETAKTSIEAMKYNELKALAAEKGLDASGTKEDLIARLKEAGIGAKASTPAPEAGNEGDEGDEPEAPQKPQADVVSPLPEAVERREQANADRALRQDALAMKKHLEKQPKVSIMIPFEAGENPEQGKKVPFHCNLNGYAMDIPRGQYVEVPQQVAQVIKERLESEGKIGRQWRIDADPNKATALS